MKKERAAKSVPGGSRSRSQTEPIRVKIEDLNEKGAGVAFYKKYKLVVPKTLPGEEVLLVYDADRPRKDRVVLKKIVAVAPQRVEPPCVYFDECGGCHLQHMDYSLQLRFKRNVVQRLLLAFPHLKNIPVHPVTGMPQPFYYRNKSQMPFQKKGDQVVFGLYRRGTHWLVPMQQCLVESRDANRILQTVRQWAQDYDIPIYDERTGEGLLRHVVVRKGMFTNQIMVVLVLREKEVGQWKTLLQALQAATPTLKSVYFNIQPEQTNVILGKENILVWGQAYIEERLGATTYRIYPHTFFQVNSVQTVKMLETLHQHVPLSPESVVLDLYSGVGTFSIHLAPHVRKVIGVENNPDAIRAAQENSRLNNCPNVEFWEGDVEGQLDRVHEREQKVDVVVVDPPRKGLGEAIVEKIARLSPTHVVYISCNPQTLVTDLDRFYSHGFVASGIFPFDMFPQTYHVETLTVLKKG